MALSQKMLEALEETVEDMDKLDPYFKAVLYGPSGVGKTVEAMELAQIVTPSDKEILYVDAVEGWVSLRNHPQLMRRTRRMVYKGLSQLDTIVQAINEGAGSFANIGTVVFDEFSTMQKKDLHTVMQAHAGSKDDPDLATFPDFNANTYRMQKAAFRLLDLEKQNLIFIAHQRQDKDTITQVSVTGPAFSPKVAETVKETMHLVARMTADIKHGKSGVASYEWAMQVHPSKMVVAKSRIGGLDVIVSPKELNARVADWLAHPEIDETREPVELASEKVVIADVSDQTAFEGFDIEE